MAQTEPAIIVAVLTLCMGVLSTSVTLLIGLVAFLRLPAENKKDTAEASKSAKEGEATVAEIALSLVQPVHEENQKLRLELEELRQELNNKQDKIT